MATFTENPRTFRDAYFNEDYPAALRLGMPLAEQGDPEAQFIVGILYAEGKGVAADIKQAFKWMQGAADQGEPYAQHWLGDKYRSGNGVPQNFGEAVRWFQLAADQNLHFAQFDLGMMHFLGQGTSKNCSKGIEFVMDAAEQGLAVAEFNLGNFFYTGNGVPVDYGAAKSWTERAAKNGHHDAQYNLGTIYFLGHGVEKDLDEAIRWFRLAAEAGDANSQAFLSSAYASGEGVPQWPEEAFAWAQKAAEKGDSGGQFNLGDYYESGFGVTRDELKSLFWFSLALEQGCPKADARVQKLLSALSPEQVTEVKRLTAKWKPNSKDPSEIKKKLGDTSKSESERADEAIKEVVGYARTMLRSQQPFLEGKGFDYVKFFKDFANRLYLVGVMWRHAETMDLPTPPRLRAFAFLLAMLVEDGMDLEKAKEAIAELNGMTKKKASFGDTAVAYGYKAKLGDGSLAKIYEHFRDTPAFQGGTFRQLEHYFRLSILVGFASFALSLIFGLALSNAEPLTIILMSIGVGFVLGFSVRIYGAGLFKQALNKDG